MHIKGVECEINGKCCELADSGAVITLFEANIDIFPYDEKEVLKVKVQFSYNVLKKFHNDLNQIANMGDIDISMIGKFPEKTKLHGEKIQDEEMMEMIQNYINTFQTNHSIVNLLLFKKLIMDIQIEESEDRTSPDKMNLFSSIRNAKDLFKNLDKPHADEESEQDEEDMI